MSKWEPKEKRVEDIVNAAIEVFLEKGYEGASMEAIAKKGQISKGGLYHHFNSKEEILYYANNKLCEPVTILLQTAVSNSDPVEGLKYYIRSYIEYWTSRPKELTFFFLSMTKALACPQMWSIYEGYYNQTEETLRNFFDRGIEAEKLTEHNTKSSAATLLSALDGIMVYLVMNKNLNQDEMIQLFEEKYILELIK